MMRFIAEYYVKNEQKFFPVVLEAQDYEEAEQMAKARETKDSTLFNVVRA